MNPLDNSLWSSQSPANDPESLSSSCHRLFLEDREVVLLGIPDGSWHLAEFVRHVLRRETPEAVCLEMDTERYAALSEHHLWEDRDLRELIREHQLNSLLLNLLFAVYQKKLGGQPGVVPGMEMLEVYTVAQEHGLPVTLCDRDVGVTLARLWRLTPLIKKLRLLFVLLRTLLANHPHAPQALRQLRQQDVITALLHDLGDKVPSLRQVFIDERDVYLAQQIRQAPGKKILAVVGNVHLPGLLQALPQPAPANLTTLATIPASSPFWKYLGRALPCLFLAFLLGIGWHKGAELPLRHVLLWVLATSIPSTIGTICARAHPLIILLIPLISPITCLIPGLGAGNVAALLQFYLCPPLGREFYTILADLRSPSTWWQSRLLRLLLVFLLPNIGELTGIWIGSVLILTDAF